MLENKSKNTAKVLSSNSEQNKTKGSKSGTTCPKGKSGNSAPIKTLDDFFNPLSNRVSHGVSQAGEISNSEGSGSNNLSFGGDGGRWEGGDDNEGTQSSIMTSVFRHIMR